MTETLIEPILRPDSLEDFFYNAVVPLAVSDVQGEILIANRAAERLHGKKASTVAAIVEDRATVMISRIVSGRATVRNVRLPADDFPDLIVDASPAFDASGNVVRIHWTFRPWLTGAAPRAPKLGGESGSDDAAVWIRQLGDEVDLSIPQAADSGLSDEKRQQLVTEYFDTSPAAIHLVSADGRVLAANQTELSILGFAGDPGRYIGRPIHQIYESQLTIEDLLMQMSTGTPTVNVRARLISARGELLNVIAFSSSRIDKDGTFLNTRCLVFPDHDPDAGVTPLRLFNWPSAS